MAKTYLKASAKARDTQFGEVIKLGVNVEELIKFAKAHANDRGWLNLDIVRRKETGPYGDTHSVVLDDYMKGSGQIAPSTHSGPVDGSDIPFAWMLPLILPALLTLHGVIA